MAKKVYTRESIAADVEAFKKGEFKKINMTLDWMDSFVAYCRPETVEEYIKACSAIAPITRKDGDKTIERRNLTEVRKYFIATYFPDFTDEALKAAKEARKAARSAAAAAKEAEKAMSVEDKFKAKMAKLMAK